MNSKRKRTSTDAPEATEPVKLILPASEKLNGYMSVFILAKPAHASAPDGNE